MPSAGGVHLIIKRLTGQSAPDPAAVEQAERNFHRFAAVLDGYLRGRRWLVGDDVTLADFAVAAPLMHAQAASFPIESYHEIGAWYHRVEALDAWQASAPAPVPQQARINGGEDHAVHAADL